MMSELKQFEEKMQKTVTALENDFKTIRAGRANPAVLDKIMVDYYGTPTPLNQVGNITIPEARIIQISPWEKAMLKEIEKAISASNLGLTPNSDGTVIRLVFPELTEDRRKDLTKETKKKGEDSKVGIRNIRREAMDSFKKSEKNKEITEDELKSLEDKIQKSTDKFVAEIDKVVEAKNKDILSV
ncbi:MAG: ribosome recycling factor [Defluviitaleaceae bacterium]|nr:ribosome recycling factor [Defluviitaleaceae bacterium]